ncbi:MAG: hypothetical protein M3Q58_06750 [Bacteroidota bacterium]|nr:hypothetical protein [Bacteroidota bacterium]
MDTELKIYHSILFLELRPWTNRNIPDPKFRELIQKVVKEHFMYQPDYEVDFPKPLTVKRKYYFSLIENEATRYLNNFRSIIEGALNDQEKTYWVHTTLTKVLIQKFKETSKTIDDNQYLLSFLAPGAKSKSDINKLDETYIVQYLKHQLIRIYIEIQDTCKDFLKEEENTEDDIHQMYFSEEAPAKSLVIPAQKIKIAVPASKTQTKETLDAVLKAIISDFRKEAKGVPEYKNIIKNPSRFASFEEKLFENGYIDIDYNSVNKHGQIQELATIFHILINKNYFNPKVFIKNKPLKPLDCRKFLDYRYSSNTYKQFRTLSKSPEKVADFLENNYWLDQLPKS